MLSVRGADELGRACQRRQRACADRAAELRIALTDDDATLRLGAERRAIDRAHPLAADTRLVGRAIAAMRTIHRAVHAAVWMTVAVIAVARRVTARRKRTNDRQNANGSPHVPSVTRRP